MAVVVEVIFGAVVGALVGLVFFGGLAYTVRRLLDARHPGRLLVGSFVARFAVLGLGLALVARVSLPALLAALVALLVSRTVIGARVVRRPVAAGDGGGASWT